jgi:hypothetical protein
MKETIFILLVVLVLFGITAIRYRKQIAGVIGFARMIRDAADPSKSGREIPESKTAAPRELVSCSSCGTWVPRDRAIRFDAKTHYCSKACVQASLTAN